MDPKSTIGEQLVELREQLYGDAARDTGAVASLFRPELDNLLATNPGAWISWIMILNKLVRALHNPTYRDSWQDIAGYAELALKYLGE